MTYLIGLIPGAIAGIAIALLVSKSMKIDKEVRWIKSEIKTYPIILFLVVTFLIGPALSFLYSWKFKTDGTDAFRYYSLSNTFNLFLFMVIIYVVNRKWGNYIYKKTGSWINKEIWKEALITWLIFVLALIWLLPLIFNRIVAGSFI